MSSPEKHAPSASQDSISAAAPNESPGATRTRATSMTEVEKNGSSRGPSPTPAAKNEEPDYDDELELERRHSLVQSLAREYTRQSQVGIEGNPFEADEDSPLNPASDNFKASSWAKAVVNLVTSAGAEFRTAGVAFQNLNVYGFGQATDYQKDVANIWIGMAEWLTNFTGRKGRRIDILRDFDGVVKKGEMLVVLGPPGSGCTTLLKTLSGETNGIYVDDKSYFNYQGLDAKEMHTHHRGEAIYTAEVDAHFPQLSVGDTLTFAAKARRPRKLPASVSATAFANHLRDVVMAMFGISHTINTRVGNEYIRGVSGGERKRVTISEAALSGAPLQCWDNSTRGLDSANAIEFCKTLRLQCGLFNNSAIVSIYQAPQSAYDLFDKATVLYEGRQIFFGKIDDAKRYFIDLGFVCPSRQTTPDFLTSMTSPHERIVRPGMEGKAPRTPDEFATAWKNSNDYKVLQAEIEMFKDAHPINGPDAEAFRANKKAQQAKAQRVKSPYTLSFGQQIMLCLTRAYKRLIGDPSLTIGVSVECSSVSNDDAHI